MLKYSQLTQTQKKAICNSCGGKGALIKVPNFLFKASCNHHDFKYWLGCTEQDRELADAEFYKWMKVDIESAKWYKKPYYHMWAYIYYKAVRKFGSKYFSYNNNYKTTKDIR